MGGGYDYVKSLLARVKLIRPVDVLLVNSDLDATSLRKNTEIASVKSVQLSRFRVQLFSVLHLFSRFQRVGILGWLFDWLSLDNFLSGGRNDTIFYFISPSRLARYVNSTPFIFTVWDLCHLYWKEFPEIRVGEEIRYRNILYDEVLEKASIVVTDNPITHDDICRYYRVTEDRICLLPFISKYKVQKSLPMGNNEDDVTRRLLMPAKFWAHKNHSFAMRTVMALNDFGGAKYRLVVTGDNDNGFRQRLANQMGVAEADLALDFHGRVTEQKLDRLYQTATAIFLPTFFGPSNLPPLEAWARQKPYISLDLPYFRSFLNDAAIFVPFDDCSEAARRIHEALNSERTKNDLVAAGATRLEQHNSDDIFWALRKRLLWLDNILDANI